MVTKSLAVTPFGMKRVYKIGGECVWSEYVSRSASMARIAESPAPKGPQGVVAKIKAGVREILHRKVS